MDAARVGPPVPGVTEVEVEGRACLLSPSTREVVLLNQTASDVWYLCDGDLTLDEVVDRLAQAYDTEPSVIRDDVTDAVRRFVDAGLLPAP